MTEVKITKRERFEDLKNVAAAAGREDLVQFIDDQIAMLDRRLEKAKEYKARKSAVSDELKTKIAAALTNSFTTADTITELVADGNEEVTKAKVTARLGQLVRAGEAEKITIKVDKRRVVAYALPGSPVESDE